MRASGAPRTAGAFLLRTVAQANVCRAIARVTLSASIVLAGCAADPARPPEARTKVVEVQVPVPVPCFDEKDRPVPPTPTPIDLEHATTDQLAAALAADHEADELYMRQIEALFIQCQQKAGKDPK